MAIGRTNSGVGGGSGGAPKFACTGQFAQLDDGNGNWRIRLLTSGVFTPTKAMTIDAFYVGGGAGGSHGQGCRGGGSGYTATHSSISLSAGTAYTIVIGAGGAATVAGGQTSGFGHSVDGGAVGTHPAGANNYYCKGGNGGSGGGANCGGDTGSGGSNGGNGTGSLYGVGGTGQGTTTREFGETTGALYAGGGGASYAAVTGQGGEGGGGTDSDGQANTGGGGASKYADGAQTDYAGGSGVIVIRNARTAA